MRNDIIIQGGTILISVILAISFFMLLFVSILRPQEVIMSLILIVMTIVLLSILSVVFQIQEDVGRLKK
jgi:hypothetical protein